MTYIIISYITFIWRTSNLSDINFYFNTWCMLEDRIFEFEISLLFLLSSLVSYLLICNKNLYIIFLCLSNTISLLQVISVHKLVHLSTAMQNVFFTRVFLLQMLHCNLWMYCYKDFKLEINSLKFKINLCPLMTIENSSVVRILK